MKCWLFFHADPESDHPEAHEARRFRETAARMGIDLKILNPEEFDLVVDTDAGDWHTTYKGDVMGKPDVIIPRTGTETSYLALAVMRHFERLGVTLVNGSAAVESVADKLHTHQILAGNGLPTPRTILGKFPVDADLIERELGFPVVVKTIKGTRGGGVFLSENKQAFKDLTALINEANPNIDFIFQKYIKSSHGRDIRALVVDGQVIACMERKSADGSFKSNISLGGNGTTFKAPKDMEQLAVATAKALNLDVAGVDILFDEHGYRICEANSSPGFKGLEPACNIDVPEVILKAARRRVRGGAITWLEPKSWLEKAGWLGNNVRRLAGNSNRQAA